MKSHAKINVFLKIVGFRGDYHELNSRFVLLDEIYDEIEFAPKNPSEISSILIECNQTIKGTNIIEKCVNRLLKCGFDEKLKDFFATNKIKITKNIPMGGGLGGGSSNAAIFLKMINQELNLGLNESKLLQIGAKIGADVPFFLSGLKSANVSGIGEIISPFDDEIPDLRIINGTIHSDTTAVYKEFRAKFTQNIDVNLANDLSKLKSREILQNYPNFELNDLLLPFTSLYGQKLENSEFLSGSGSSKFALKG